MANFDIRDLVEKYSDMVMKIAFNNCFNKSDSEDIVQEVFIKLIKNINNFKNESHIKPWIIRVTINECKDYNKNAWYKNVQEIDENVVEYYFDESEKDLMKEISKLNQVQRNIIYLYYYEGYKIREISQIMDLNENTVSSHLTRARQELRDILEEGGEAYA